MEIPKVRWARTVDGATIAYQDFGEGPVTLVVIHGWVSHLEVYWEQPRYVRFMRRLSRRMRVLPFDKRGVGMSDRLPNAPDLETRMDDVRAVMDAAGVESAALFGWGTGGPPLAAFYAATHPDRTLALCIDPNIQERSSPDFPYGDDFWEEPSAEWLASWGSHATIAGFDAPPRDSEFTRWANRMFRFAATPTSYESFNRSWYETDIRAVLPTIQVPTLVIAKTVSSFANPDAAANVAARIPGARVAVVPGNEGVVWFEEPEPYVSAIEAFLEGIRAEQAEFDRVLATVLFTDIVGSTQKAAELGDRAWKELLDRHHALVRGLLGRYHGTEVDTAGDGFFATFDGPARAVRCAHGITEAVKPLGIQVRAGVHTGEIEFTGGDFRGIAVHIGARVGALAGGSEILATSTVKDLVAGSGLVFQDAGEHELKGVPDRWHLYRVVSERA
ncbi:MAG: adenylate/guanylate cyclase domain-containing protein [Actinomycetota bacterium]|nr:adenylate/guanylate cyclase domain-containing protein [Actinomycetota bacterium]